MKGNRKFWAFIFVIVAYIVGCALTGVAVTAGGFISLSGIFTLGNATEHLGGKISISPGPGQV